MLGESTDKSGNRTLSDETVDTVVWLLEDYRRLISLVRPLVQSSDEVAWALTDLDPDRTRVPGSKVLVSESAVEGLSAALTTLSEEFPLLI